MTRSDVKIALVADFDPDFVPHPLTERALHHGAEALALRCTPTWLPTSELVEGAEDRLAAFDGLYVAPGSPYRSLQGALNAITYARLGNMPLLGSCGGYQHVVIEYARRVLGIEDAQHAEYDPYASRLFISALSCSLAGKRMTVTLKPGSRAAEAYGRLEGVEKYYCNFGLNPDCERPLEAGGLKITGSDLNGEARILELPDRRFFLATLFVPGATSSSEAPHPLIVAFLRECARG